MKKINKSILNYGEEIYNKDGKNDEKNFVPEFASCKTNNFYYEINNFLINANENASESALNYIKEAANKVNLFVSKTAFNHLNNNNITNNPRLNTYETSISNMYHIDHFFDMGKIFFKFPK